MKTYAAFRKKSFASILGFRDLFVALSNRRADGVQTDVPALKDVFKDDFHIGCLLSYTHIGLPDDPSVEGQSVLTAPEGGRLIAYHMNSMSPGNMMKALFTVDTNASAAAVKEAGEDKDKREYAETHPVIGFNPNLVAQLNWAKRRGFTFRGHTLVWHQATPVQFFTAGYANSGERVSKAVMTRRLENYIGEVIRLIHEGWPGLLSAMDVVNEAVDDSGNPRTAKNDWYATFGDLSYVAKAFEFARKYTTLYGETQMKLYYNDYDTSSPIKADGIVKLLQPIYRAGHLDGIGMQEHDGMANPRAEAWIASYDKFAPICAEMAVTELDVTISAGPDGPTAETLQTQANQYAALFKLFLERSARSGRGKIVSVSKDGLNDKFTFRPNQASSLWDANYQCKPAFYAVVDLAKNHKELSSLIANAGKLKRKDFSAAGWQALNEALASAKGALARNYSPNDSAATGLGNAVKSLRQAMKSK